MGAGSLGLLLQSLREPDMKRGAFSLLFIVVFAVCVRAQSPLDNVVIRPETIFQNRQKLQLSDEQIGRLQDRMRDVGQQLQPLQRRFQQESNRLAQMIAADKGDDQILAQHARQLEAEKAMREFQLTLMIDLRRQLTSQQRKLAIQLQNQNRSPVANQPQQARFEKTKVFPKQRAGTLLEQGDFDSVQQRIAKLKQPEVAWRKIGWRTCLLDGLKDSKEQKKPLLLWIFIDRPIDDERC